MARSYQKKRLQTHDLLKWWIVEVIVFAAMVMGQISDFARESLAGIKRPQGCMIKTKHSVAYLIVDSTIEYKVETHQVVTLLHLSFPIKDLPTDLYYDHHLHLDDLYQILMKMGIMVNWNLLESHRTWLSIKHYHEPTINCQDTSGQRMRGQHQQTSPGRHTLNAHFHPWGFLML